MLISCEGGNPHLLGWFRKRFRCFTVINRYRGAGAPVSSGKNSFSLSPIGPKPFICLHHDETGADHPRNGNQRPGAVAMSHSLEPSRVRITVNPSSVGSDLNMAPNQPNQPEPGESPERPDECVPQNNLDHFGTPFTHDGALTTGRVSG